MRPGPFLRLVALCLFMASSTTTTTAAKSRQIVDALTGFAQIDSHSEHLVLDRQHAENFDGDVSRLTRSDNFNEHVIWKLNDVKLFHAVSWHWPHAPQPHFEFYVSKDKRTWKAVLPSVVAEPENLAKFGQTNAWRRIVYSLDSTDERNNLPEGTRYIKVEFPLTSEVWTPQIGSVMAKDVERDVSQGAQYPDETVGFIKRDLAIEVSKSSDLGGFERHSRLMNIISHTGGIIGEALAIFLAVAGLGAVIAFSTGMISMRKITRRLTTDRKQ